MSQREKGRTFDGISRPSDDNYRKNFDRIFKTNPVAKEVRKEFDRIFGKKKKTTSELLMEGYEEEKKMYEEE